MKFGSNIKKNSINAYRTIIIQFKQGYKALNTKKTIGTD